PKAFFRPNLSARVPANKLAIIMATEAELRIITMSKDACKLNIIFLFNVTQGNERSLLFSFLVN
ncbi:hypothetical protein KAS06_01025, partial [Candidatus Bathyarchaeota archaeon]|nr:hypothetical protein [Candidatus Bathyarchaeota archaeon]